MFDTNVCFLYLLSLLELWLIVVWRGMASHLEEGYLWENNFCELKVKCLCTFSGYTLECSRDIHLPFQFHILGIHFLVYLRVEQPVILFLNMITEEAVILPFFICCANCLWISCMQSEFKTVKKCSNVEVNIALLSLAKLGIV